MNLDFEVLELENIKFSHNELLNYYYILEKEFQSLKWSVDEKTDIKNHEVFGLYSWAIQSNLKNPLAPCPPYDIKHDNEVVGTFDVPTPLVFGFAEKFLNLIPGLRQTVIVNHPPGVKIHMHKDNEEFFKIHIPIITNDNAFFCFEKTRYNLKAGKAYLINTEKIHGTENLGDSDRIHFITKIRVENISTIINSEYHIH